MNNVDALGRGMCGGSFSLGQHTSVIIGRSHRDGTGMTTIRSL